MKKSYLMMAAAAALFAACSSNDLAEEKSPQITQQTAEQVVGFDATVTPWEDGGTADTTM